MASHPPALFLLALLAVVTSVRVRRHRAAQGDFRCPEECMECCAAARGPSSLPHFRSGPLFKNNSSFKCILKNSSDTPDGRRCGNASTRTSNARQSKVECEFNKDELGSKPSGSLGQCSYNTRCCCTEDEDWTEPVRMVLGTSAPFVNYAPRWSNPSTPERAMRVEQMYDNDKGDCKRPESKKSRVIYQIYESVSFFKSMKSMKDGHRIKYIVDNSDYWSGCCLVLKNTPVKYDYAVYKRLGSYPWTKEIRGCAKWEQLYTCTNDEGLTQACEMYKRVSKGVCVSDKGEEGALHLDRTSPLGHPPCPKGHKGDVSGGVCQCPAECGGTDTGF